MVKEFVPDVKNNSLTLTLEPNELILPWSIRDAEEAIREAYELESVKTKMLYDIEEMSRRDIETMMAFLCDKYPSLKAALNYEKISFEKNKLILHIIKEMFFRVESIRADMEKLLAEWLGEGILISLVECENTGKSFDRIRAEEIKKLEDEARASMANESSKPKAKTENKPAGDPPWKKKKDPNAVMFKPDKEGENVIYGKPVAREFTNIADIIPEGSKVTVKGRIFYRET